MSQPGRPSKPDAFWWDLDKELLMADLDPVLAGPVLTIFKRYVVQFKAELNLHETLTREQVWNLFRDHLYGHSKPGKS